ncbi:MULTISPECIES: DUF3304 domain-containing protein [unclassified Janthinobacterium]|uniref:DUF3304 domain-containing protein n=1 Tax=unclassified Janthinobacterium TaxID=2610881 RepID=UPI0009DAA801|nr:MULTISPECIES: DUF3304 domain-containing protein [unclassified Janthinobacterium]MEC5163993.1 hypothetical protein [Janthinobacterium sp. CG_S6]
MSVNILFKIHLPFFLIFLLSGCNVQQADPIPKEKSHKPVNLTLSGYNYTNRYIDTFSVNEQGGGNLFISGPTSGGGGSVCCVGYVPDQEAMEVEVRWQADACRYDEGRTVSGEMVRTLHSYFKEVKVIVDRNIPANPAYFEVHIYQDGHVEAAITEEPSEPRLKLNMSREDTSPYPDCPAGKKPKKSIK